MFSDARRPTSSQKWGLWGVSEFLRHQQYVSKTTVFHALVSTRNALFGGKF